MHSLIAYLRFRLKAGNEHGLHSPFVFQLYTEAIKPKKQYIAFEAIENIRAVLLSDETVIEVEDFGAGSKQNKTASRKVKDIARHSISKPKIGQLLFKLVDFFKPQTIVELGTGLGIGTLYMSEASSRATIYTFEGSAAIADVAWKWLQNTYADLHLVTGNIDQTLPVQLKQLEKIDFVYFDANHRYEPTIRYFEWCLGKKTEESVFVFDDIHWSEEMEKAWEEIKNHPEVIVTVDLFYVGLVFFRKKQPKQHFKLRLNG